MSFKAFQTQRRASDGEDVSFTINGMTFFATPDPPGGALLLAGSLEGKEPAQQMASVGVFLDAVLLEESRARFEKALYSSDPKANITLEEVADIVKWLMEDVYVGRPTTLSSATPSALSPDGTTSTAPVPEPELTP